MATNFRDHLPDIDDPEFQNCIKRPARVSDELKPEPQQHGHGAFLKPLPQHNSHEVFDDALPESAHRRQHTYASFGDSGTTATVNGYGTIMRLSKYLGGENNRSKMFGLEFPGGKSPYQVTWRAETFHDLLPSPCCGFGLQIVGIDQVQPGALKLKFLNDRWPQITYSINGFSVRVRLFCKNGTVIQQFTVTNTLTSPAKMKFILAVDFSMHSLNYMHWSGSFHPVYELGPHGHSVVIQGRRTDEENKDGTEEENEDGTEAEDEDRTEKKNEDGIDEQVGVLVGLFRNGESEQLEIRNGESEQPENPLVSNVEDRIAVNKEYSFKESETLELTAAFRLQYLERSPSWKDFILPISDVDVSEITQEPVLTLNRWPFRRGDDDVLNRHLRRNLEHILSVCSIPIKRGEKIANNAPIEQDEDNLATQIILTRQDFDADPGHSVSLEDEREVTSIALTCGDFGDHRVSVSGSFFAFKYLLSMYEQLGNRLDGNSGTQSLRSRIRDTCKGHLRWVSELNHNKAFASNFWVDGNIIEQSSYTSIPPDSPANMPTHILKATEFLTVFKEPKDHMLVAEWLPSFVISWIKTLNKTKNHLATTWRHLPDDAEIATYRISDHVWIWRALQSIENLVTRVEDIKRSSPHVSLDKILELRNHLHKRTNRGDGAESRLEFTAEELRRQILRRFTVENDVSKKRTLSVTRSAQETRFLFHSRDTVLYYGIEWGFFRDDSQPNSRLSELWERLAQAQPGHDESDEEVQWDNPLRYALAVRMGVENHQFDKNYSATDMATHARGLLFGSSSENFLFPGKIDETTKEPKVFDLEEFRDFYFHAGFEIPYVLLLAETKSRERAKLKGDNRDGEQEGEIQASEHGKEGKGSEAMQGPFPNQPKHQPTKRPTPSPIIGMVDLLQSSLEPSENRDPVAGNDGGRNVPPDGLKTQIARSLKRQMPYNKLVDLSNIVEVSEEWLYNYPSFLNFKPPEDKAAVKTLRQLDRTAASTIAKCIPKREFSIQEIFGEDVLPEGCIKIDVPKGKKKSKKADNHDSPEFYYTYQDFWSVLQKERIAKDAKKRLIYLGPGDCRIAALCYLASPNIEREPISHFFDRHGESGEYFFDDTILASNGWETELHISFYQLVKSGPVKDGPTKVDSTERNVYPVRNVKSRPYSFLDKNSVISIGAIGFRIVGDFIDRYWTCHIIGNFSNSEDNFKISDEEHWKQRKVLELILFERILSKVCQGANDIIGAIEKAKIEKGKTKETDNGEEDIFGNLRLEHRKIESLQEIQQILIALNNNFVSILGTIELWRDRESTSGQERPRWTRNDEQKYRQSIKKRSTRQAKFIRELKTIKAKVDFLITLVTSAQEAIRSTRSLDDAKNIRLFTYVTAFFLPVGLASSLFGMGQIPERNVIISMVITGAIALFVTGLVLSFFLYYPGKTRIQEAWGYIKPFKHMIAKPKSDRKRSDPESDRERSEPQSDRAQMNLKALLRRRFSGKITAERKSVGGNDLETGKGPGGSSK